MFFFVYQGLLGIVYQCHDGFIVAGIGVVANGLSLQNNDHSIDPTMCNVDPMVDLFLMQFKFMNVSFCYMSLLQEGFFFLHTKNIVNCHLFAYQAPAPHSQ